MKREILFRGFCPDENGTQIAVVNGKGYKGEWKEGYIAKCFKNWNMYIVVTVFERDEQGNLLGDRKEALAYKVIPDTVGQFTGLTDKNGKKIFEHDRIKYTCGDKAKVIFSGYGAFVGLTEMQTHENIGGVLTEVIGTIFDKEEV